MYVNKTTVPVLVPRKIVEKDPTHTPRYGPTSQIRVGSLTFFVGRAGGRGCQDESGGNELDQLGKIFMHCGTPTDASWPGVSELHRFVEFQPCAAAPRLLPLGTAAGDDPEAAQLVQGLLTLDPNQAGAT